MFLEEYSAPQPGIVFIKKERLDIINLEEGILGVPDLIIEIISPTSIKRGRFDKKELYEKFQVPEYWIVDPANASIEVYVIKDGKYALFSFGTTEGKVQSQALNGWELELASVFG